MPALEPVQRRLVRPADRERISFAEVIQSGARAE